ncbi:MAG: HAD-IC family P-type ATPase, partial [Pseudomonadota bacterium]
MAKTPALIQEMLSILGQLVGLAAAGRVPRMPAIETLGAVSVICSDKTGTLTRNEMMVAEAVAGGRRFRIAGDGYRPEGAIRAGDDAPVGEALAALAAAAAFCNDAALDGAGGGWRVEGDPMEGALLAFAAKAFGGADALTQRMAEAPRIAEIPFDSQHRFMGVLMGGGGATTILVKGAPERVAQMCADQRNDQGAISPLDETFWAAEAHRLAAAGMRVLALAERRAEPTATGLDFADVEGRMTMLGLVGVIDPPRPDAIAAVADCRRAGVRVQMITGDHAVTAAAIAREIGLEKTAQALTGAEIDLLDDAALAAAVAETDVFARTSPENKLRLVKALQAQGLTVAMTGDGVNDAPALKRADAGVAMGLNGSQAAKEAADIVLAD